VGDWGITALATAKPMHLTEEIYIFCNFTQWAALEKSDMAPVRLHIKQNL
jgi:hypothetical protein